MAEYSNLQQLAILLRGVKYLTTVGMCRSNIPTASPGPWTSATKLYRSNEILRKNTRSAMDLSLRLPLFRGTFLTEATVCVANELQPKYFGLFFLFSFDVPRCSPNFCSRGEDKLVHYAAVNAAPRERWTTTLLHVVALDARDSWLQIF